MAKIFQTQPNFEQGFSSILFALYKLKNDENFALLSELPFVLDSKNLLNLLEYFGGRTITIPTKEDLMIVTASLSLLYKNFNGTDYEQYGIDPNLDKSKVLDCYNKIKQYLS